MQYICSICQYLKDRIALIKQETSPDYCIHCRRITPTLEIKDRTTDIYRYKANAALDFHDLGRFYIVKFSKKDREHKIMNLGFRPTLQCDIFCYVLEDKDWSDDWKTKAKKQTFKIKKIIDLQRLQQWFENEKKKPHVKVSPFFIN